MPAFAPPTIAIDSVVTGAVFDSGFSGFATSANGVTPEDQIEPGEIDHDKCRYSLVPLFLPVGMLLNAPAVPGVSNVREFVAPAGGYLASVMGSGTITVTVFVADVQVGTFVTSLLFGETIFASTAFPVRRGQKIRFTGYTGTDLAVKLHVRMVMG